MGLYAHLCQEGRSLVIDPGVPNSCSLCSLRYVVLRFQCLRKMITMMETIATNSTTTTVVSAVNHTPITLILNGPPSCANRSLASLC
jgi:hypothetical protein